MHGIAFLSLFSQWEMKDIHVEEAREMYGLLIVAVWMAAIAVASWRRNYNRPFAPG
ncbi:MAG TPA: transmembrane 220 family protein [Gemmatimonadaceae bacterium]|nr:transmembrane 220 family protein [Gemmatimonadaceae bacterium]